MKGIWKLLATASLFLACVVPAMADEAKNGQAGEQGNAQANGQAVATEPAKSDRTMETVVVTASRVEEKMKTVTQSMTVIPKEELDKNQYHDLGDMLKNYGVDVQGNNSTASFSQISIRGLSTLANGNFGNDCKSSVLTLIDGRRTPTTNISMIPMVSIERVEIMRGPGALQYGSQAIGGVVNVITKRGGKEWKISAEGGYGSWETVKGMAALSGMIGPVDIAGGISSMKVGEDYKAGNGKRYGNTAVTNRTSYILNAGLNFLDEHRIGISLIGMENNEMGSPSYAKERGPDSWGYRHTPYQETERAEYSWDVLYEGGYKKYGLSWKARYFNGHSRYSDDNNGMPPTYIYDPATYAVIGSYQKDTMEIDSRGAQGQIAWTSKFLDLTGGIDWYNYDYRPSKYWGLGFSNNNETENLAGFAIAKIKLFDDFLILNGGIRYDDFTLKFQGNNKKMDNTSYSLGIAINPTDWLKLRANYGTSFNLPTPLERAGFNADGYRYYGNPDLDPQHGRGWDAGFDLNYKSFKASFSYFETAISDYITRVPISGGSKYVNLSGESLLRGIEGNASVDIGELFDWPFQLRPYVNFTHLFQAETASSEIITGVRNLELAYGLNFNYPSIGLTADLRFIYLGHMMENDTFDWTRNSQKYDGHTTRRRTGGDSTVDFYITKTIWDWEEGGKLSIKGEVRNIMNVNYDSVYGYPQPGRSFYVGLRYDF